MLLYYVAFMYLYTHTLASTQLVLGEKSTFCWVSKVHVHSKNRTVLMKRR